MFVILPILALFGCKRPPDAPKELGELMLFSFEHFEDKQPDNLIAAVPGFEDYLLGLDLTASLNDRAVTPPTLTSAHLGGLTFPDGTGPDAQVPVAVSALSRHSADKHVQLAGETNFVCIDADSAKFSRREHLTDHGCFQAGTCDFFRSVNEIRRETLLLKVWYDLFKDFRAVELEDGRTVVYSRAWTERPFRGDGGDGSWDQSFILDISIPHPQRSDKTLRFYAQWGSVTIKGVGDTLYASTVKASIDEGFENADNFISGELCGNPRNRRYDRP